MDVVLHSIESVLGIALMVVVGLVMAKRGWIDDSGSLLMAKLVIKVAMPCMVLVNITDNFKRGNLHVLFYDLALPTVSMIACYFIGSFCCSLLKVPRGRREIFKTTFYVTNCLFIGIPVNVELFGEGSIVHALEYYVANTIALWTVGVYQIAAEASGGKTKFNLFQTIKSIVMSPMLGLIIAIILILLGIELPGLLKSPLRYLGSMTTPLSMLFIGVALSRVKLADLTITREMFVAYIGRFAIGPLTLFAAYPFIPAGELLFKVTLIESIMPVASAIPTLAATYGLDVKYSAILACVSTVLFIAVVPVYMWIMHIFFGG